MNKYQEKACEMLGLNLNSFGSAYSKALGKNTCILSIKDDSILVVDDRNYYSKDYALKLNIKDRDGVRIFVGGQWKKPEPIQEMDRNGRMWYGTIFEFNMDKKPEKIELSFPNDVVDPLVIDIKYDLTSKEEYDRIQNSPESLRRKMAVQVKKGDALLNVLWQPAKENAVAFTRIDLYAGSAQNRMLMGKFKVDGEMFFKSIAGLTPGKYCIQVVQFDKDGKELVASDFIEASI